MPCGYRSNLNRNDGNGTAEGNDWQVPDCKIRSEVRKQSERIYKNSYKKSQAVHIRDMTAFFLENKVLILYNGTNAKENRRL